MNGKFKQGDRVEMIAGGWVGHVLAAPRGDLVSVKWETGRHAGKQAAVSARSLKAPTLAETKQAVADLGVRTAKRALRQSAKAVALHAQPGAALYEGDALSAQAVLARGAPVAVVDGEAARTISANATQAKLELYPELIELLREIEGAGLIAYTDCAKTARALLTRHSMIEAGES